MKKAGCWTLWFGCGENDSIDLHIVAVEELFGSKSKPWVRYFNPTGSVAVNWDRVLYAEPFGCNNPSCSSLREKWEKEKKDPQ